MRLLGLCLVLLSGCASPWGVGGMTAGELRELAKIKDAGVTCVRGIYAGVSINMLAIDVDKGIPAGIKIKESCEVDFSTVPPTKP